MSVQGISFVTMETTDNSEFISCALIFEYE